MGIGGVGTTTQTNKGGTGGNSSITGSGFTTITALGGGCGAGHLGAAERASIVILEPAQQPPATRAAVASVEHGLAALVAARGQHRHHVPGREGVLADRAHVLVLLLNLLSFC